MSILSKLKRLSIRNEAVHETTYSAHGIDVILETTNIIRKNLRDADVLAMSKLALDEYLSDFEFDRIAANIEMRYNVSDYGEVAVFQNGRKELVIYIQ